MSTAVWAMHKCQMINFCEWFHRIDDMSLPKQEHYNALGNTFKCSQIP